MHESGPGEAEKAYLAEDNSTFDTAEGSEISLSLDDLDDASRFPPARVCVTMQCAGNRRSELHALAPTQGLHWGCGAVSTAGTFRFFFFFFFFFGSSVLFVSVALTVFRVRDLT